MLKGSGSAFRTASRVSLVISVAIVAGFLLSSFGAGIASSQGDTAVANSSSLLASAEASLESGRGPADGYSTACQATSGSSASCSSSAAGPSASPPSPMVKTTGGEWVPVNYSRAYTALAYDARDAYVIAFGGMGPNGALGDTWKYAEGNWSLVLTQTAPSPRWGAAMTYDDSLARIVLFGGENGTAYFNDTWQYAGGIWTNVSGSHAPSPRAFAGLTYDANPSDNYTVLFGGTNATTVLSDTWEFHAGTWTTLITAQSPVAVYGSSFVYDRHTGYAVLFGGVQQGGTYSSATWTYQSGVWTEPTEITSPSARAYAGMAYDRDSSVTALVLFGGISNSGYDGDTWEFVGHTWTLISASTPGLAPRAGVALAFDGRHPDFYVVLWGGLSAPGTYPTDTWNFTGTAWSEVSLGGHPGALTGAVLVNVPYENYVVLFGGLGTLGATNATWLFSGGSWTLLCGGCGPSPRYDAAATFSPVLGGVILFGGYNGVSFLNDTWEFVNTAWVNVTGVVAPSVRDLAGFAYEGTPVKESILFGGYNGVSFLNDTWEFNSTTGAWSSPFAVTTPPAGRADPTLTNDGPDGYLLLFGGYNRTSVFNDSWAFRGNLAPFWSQLAPLTHPAARFGARAAYDPYNGYVVLTGGNNTTAAFNDTWGFIAGNWTQFAPPLSPPARSDAALAFDRGDKYIVQFGGSGSTGSLLSDTWLWVAFSAQATAAPDPTDVGVQVAFGVSAVAGVPPYSYSWTFGDGSPPSTSATPLHTYSTSGTYNASVTVTDSRLPTPDQTVANVTVIVNPMLAVVTASATPSVAAPGASIDFNSTSSGGTRPITYAWTFGDSSRATTENATHAYLMTGTFTATVYVNDTAGGNVTKTVTVLITTGLSAIVSAQPLATDVGLPVTFSSTPTGGTTPYVYAWQFGNGQGSSSEDTTYAYGAAGIYHVEYWVNDSAGHHFTANLSVTVAPLPSATISVQPTTTDIGLAVTFTSTVSNGTAPFTYLWTFGDGDQATAAATSHAYATAGMFTVTFVATDNVAQQTTPQTTTVTVVAAPTATVSATPSASDVGVAVAFSATGSGGASALSYAWVFGDGGTATGTTASHSYAASGTYTAIVWANDSVGGSGKAMTTVTVAADPSVSTFTVSSRSVTSGTSVTFSATVAGGTGAFSYAYSGLPSGCTSANQASLTCKPSATGTYLVQLTVTDAFGKSATGSVTLKVTPPAPTFLGLPQTEGILLLVALLVVVIALVLAINMRRGPRRGAGQRIILTPSEKGTASKTPPASPPSGGGSS